VSQVPRVLAKRAVRDDEVVVVMTPNVRPLSGPEIPQGAA
jgi:hypothetical protein